MKNYLLKFPNLAVLGLLLLVFSTSCNKETDLVSEFVIQDSTNSIGQNDNAKLADAIDTDNSN